MIVIIETDDFRGDHAKDVEFTINVPDNAPISELVTLARFHKTYKGGDATLRIPPQVADLPWKEKDHGE